jgi:diguanylate cyclase (GGDEF)-like protein
MNPKSGKMFSVGHALIPIVLIVLFLDAGNKQPVILLLALFGFLWSVFLIWLAFSKRNMDVFYLKQYYWFFILVDFVLITAVSTLPVWEAAQKPTWLLLFVVPFYAFELGVLASAAMSALGILDLYAYHLAQKTPLLDLDTFLILLGMLICIFFIGLNTDNLNRVAFFDILTQLPNRQMFKERLQIQLSGRKGPGLTGILFVDLDQFKYVNDTMGHGAGDELLRNVSNRLKKILPRNAVLARMGGDEFSILLTEMKHSDDAAHTAEKIIEALKPSFPLSSQEIYITSSIGISVHPEDGRDADTLMKNADTAMYRAKEHGRNNYQFYTPSVHTKGIKRLQMETMMRHALERDEFVLYYQPRVCTGTGELICVEALVRWQHPELGMIQPMEFIPLAEDTGLIVQIGESVLRKACSQRRKWTEAGLPPFRVSVNLSPRQFRQMELPEVIQKVLKECGIPPGQLELEITESAAMQDVNYAILMLKVLKEMDLTIAIDDFGTGYSSLSYLKRFPIDIIKIDKSFISGIKPHSDDAAIAQAIIVLGHTLKLSVTAEGVETTEQHAFLKHQKCDEIQGFLIGKPMNASTFEEWLQLEKETFDAADMGF